ncbi:EF-hand domain-containing protein [Vogesella facilis]|uniref:EF-hand domain-containing protein n=1 Tax=Vogesella facilis TaxID=1655232 RepID=A0ABV7RE93_9NEIS
MTSAIGSYGGYQSAMPAMQGQRPRRPDASEMAADLFKTLDTQDQGYLQASDFSDALSAIGGSSDDGQQLFSALDSNSDGKLTQDELTSKLKEIESQMDSEFNAMRTQGMAQQMMAGGMQGMMGGGMPPPPPQGSDDGLDQDQLSAMASSASDSGDTAAADRFSTLAANFDAADTDGDGKVSFQESIAYEQSQNSSASDDNSDSSSDSRTVNARALHRLLGMLRQYGNSEDSGNSQLFSTAV